MRPEGHSGQRGESITSRRRGESERWRDVDVRYSSNREEDPAGANSYFCEPGRKSFLT